MRIAFVFVTSVVSLLSGCAATWDHPKYVNETARNKQFKLDDGYCAAVAAGAAPMPAVPTATTQTSAGTITVFDRSAARYTTYNYQDTNGAEGGFASGMSQGISTGAAFGAMMAAKRDRQRIHDGCMYRLGWVEGSIERSKPESRAAATSQLASSSAVAPPPTTGTAAAVADAIAQVPRLAYLWRVSPPSFNEVAALDTKMRQMPTWRTRPLHERFEAATQAYEAIYGKIYLASDSAPNDSLAIKDLQRSMADFAAIVPVARAKGDTKTEEAARAQVESLEHQIWDMRRP